jgi:Xaa-Pro aminopeptidase
MTVTSDRSAKIARLRGILEAHDAPAIALTRPESLAWLLDGARVTVPYGGAAVCTAIVRRDGGLLVIAHANEAERLRSEELADDIEVQPVPWHRPLPAPGPGMLREDDHLAELRTARARLLPGERAKYAQLGADTARILGEELRRARPEERERDLAARLAAAVVRRGAEPGVGLGAGG